MCNEHQVLSMMDMNERCRRKNKTLQCIFMNLLTKPNASETKFGTICEPGKPPRFSLKKTVCVITAIVAFSLGLTVGILIPLYFVPSNQNDISNLVKVDVLKSVVMPSNKDRNTVRSIDNKINDTLSKPYQTVSFVDDTHSGNMNSLVNSKLLNGIYWSDYVESTLPSGYNDLDEERWKRFVKSTPIVKIEEGCGRMQNRLVTFEDGTKACCRYRQNTDQIQGEIFSYFLGRILKLNNLVPSTLAVVKTNDPNWSQVKSQISLSQWAEDRPVVLTKFVENLQPARIPKSLRKITRRLHPIDVGGGEEFLERTQHLRKRIAAYQNDINSNDVEIIGADGKIGNILDRVGGDKEIVELAQWSDLIIFDYLTANLDRIVNNLYNLQWNPEMMESPAHNLAKNVNSNLLLFLDNESGLLHGYRLLDKYEPYHSVLLDALCIFRRSTIDVLSKLRNNKNAGRLLNDRLVDKDILPGLPEKSVNILNTRLDRVLQRVAWCASQYSQPA